MVFLVLIQNTRLVRDNGANQTKEGYRGRKPVSKKLLGRVKRNETRRKQTELRVVDKYFSKKIIIYVPKKKQEANVKRKETRRKQTELIGQVMRERKREGERQRESERRRAKERDSQKINGISTASWI